MTTITVTAEHIAEGVPGECTECPIALAIAEAIPELREVAVYTDHVGIWTDYPPGRTFIEVVLPEKAAAFIKAYDGTMDGEPFSFDLDYPAVAA